MAKPTKNAEDFRPRRFLFLRISPTLLIGSDLCEALAAVYRTIRLRLKRYTGFRTAHGTGCYEILTWASRGVLSRIAAVFAALRLVLESTLCVELLLTSGKDEIFSALLALQGLVCIHVFYLAYGFFTR